jgi:hypothetical protein
MILRATTRRTGERRSHGRAGRGAQAGISVSWAAEGVAAEEEGFEPGGANPCDWVAAACNMSLRRRRDSNPR